MGLRSVQPLIIKYKNPFIANECCAYNLLAHSIMYGSMPGSSCSVRLLPTFVPNDYFFEHYQRKGELKWETYARVIRDIMAKAGNFKISDKSVEDKDKFMKLI